MFKIEKKKIIIVKLKVEPTMMATMKEGRAVKKKGGREER